MFSTRAILLFSLVASSVLASPIWPASHLRAARDEAILYPRQDQSTLSQPVTFQTVTTSQTDAGPITTTCTVTLSPVTAADGSTQVLEEKQCKIDVGTGGESSSSSSSGGNGGGDNTSQTSTTSSSTETATQPQETPSLTSSSLASTTATGVPAISEIGVGTIPAATDSVSSPSSSASATTSESVPPAVSVVGPGQISATATGTVQPTSSADTDTSTDTDTNTDAASATTPVTSVTTLSNGQVSTSIITPSAAAAQEAAATTPGQKLEVLPIGLGVFAGVSVIALIVVGLVTYERTKYRKAFRQRKLAESGANLGYGGMAERT